MAGVFDAQTTRTFASIALPHKEVLAAHMTFAMYVGASEAQVAAWAEPFCRAHAPLDLTLAYLGTFGADVLFVAPVVDDALLRFHRAFHAQLDELHGDIGRPYSLRGAWIPHISIAVRPQGPLQDILAVAQQTFRPMQARIEALTCVSFYPPREFGKFALAGAL